MQNRESNRESAARNINIHIESWWFRYDTSKAIPSSSGSPDCKLHRVLEDVTYRQVESMTRIWFPPQYGSWARKGKIQHGHKNQNRPSTGPLSQMQHLNAFDTWIETASSQTIGSPVPTATIKMNITTDTTLPNFSSYLSPWHLCPLLCAASHGYHGWMSQLDIRSRARLLQLHAAFDHEPCVLVYWNRGNPTRPGKPTSFTWLSAWLSAFWSRISLQRILMGSRAALSFVAWKASVPKSFEDGKTCLEQHAVGQW